MPHLIGLGKGPQRPAGCRDARRVCGTFVCLLREMTMVAPRRQLFEKPDTDMVRVLTGTSAVARLKAGFRMWTAARAIVRAAVVRDHADWPPARIDREVANRMSHGLVSRVGS